MDKGAMARADRLQARRVDLSKLKSTELVMLAADRGVVFDPTNTREENDFELASAMIDAEDEEAAAGVAREQEEKAKAEKEAFYRTKEGKAQRERDERQARDRRIRVLHGAFIRAIPNEARSRGTYAVPESSPDAAAPDVPDGAYRVSGSDWILTFKGGCWVQASRAHDRSQPDWVEIPNIEGAPVGVRVKPATVDD